MDVEQLERGPDLGPRPEQTEVERRVEQLYKVDEVARMWEVGRSKIYELIRSGELRSLLIGGSRRVPESAISDFIARAS